MQIKWPILNEQQALQTGFVALLIYIALLCFQPLFPPITGAIGLYWLFYVLSFKKDRLFLILKNPYSILWICYYVVLLLGLIYTSNTAEGWKDVLLKITLLLWPLAFSSWPAPILKYKDKLLQAFAWLTSLSGLIAVVIGLFRWQASGTGIKRIYSFITIWEFIPNHYMAMYASFSVFIFIMLYINKKQNGLKTVIGLILLLALIGITSVRIQLIAIPITAFVFVFYHKTSKIIKRKLITGSIGVVIAMAAIVLILPSTRNRLNETIDEIRSINGMVNNKQTNHRVFLWKYGMDVIEDNFWIGTGTGSGDEALGQKLENCTARFWDGHTTYLLGSKNYNYHNSYLQHFATHGIIGFLLFITIMFGPFIISRKSIGSIEAVFLTIASISFFTESMLERQAGVLFFGFFYSLLFIAPFSESKATGK